MKRISPVLSIVAAAVLVASSSAAFAGKRVTSSCEWVPAAKLASNVSQAQADMIMEQHCSGTSNANIALMFASANPPLSEADVKAQVCLLNTSATGC